MVTTKKRMACTPMRNSTCKDCGSPFHSAWYHKPRKPLKTHKPMNKIGPVQKKTAAAVAKWKKTQTSNHEGYHVCYIGGEWIEQYSAEHPYSKARHPELRNSQKFEKVCDEHNALKGSLDIDEFLEKYPQFKATVKQEYLKGAIWQEQ